MNNYIIKICEVMIISSFNSQSQIELQIKMKTNKILPSFKYFYSSKILNKHVVLTHGLYTGNNSLKCYMCIYTPLK